MKTFPRILAIAAIACLAPLGLPAVAAPTQLTSGPFFELTPQWNSDGTKIAYAKQVSSGGTYDIGQVNADGTNDGFLATNVDIQSYGMSWLGSTGKLLVAEVNGFHELFEFNASAYTTAAPFNRTVVDGNDAAFTRKLLVPGGNNSNIFICSRDGMIAVWRDSPNNGGTTTIRSALYSSLAGQNTNAVGTILISSSNSVVGLRGMALTPDGSKLVVALPAIAVSASAASATSAAPPASATGFDLWLYNTNGVGAPVQLTFDGASGKYNGNPDVSPDGTKILFAHGTAGVAGTSDIYLMNIDGTGLANVSNTPGVDESDPAWAPNGRDFAFVRFDGGTNFNIYKDSLSPIAGGTDFNGDGHPDYLLFNASSLQTAIWYLNGPSFVSAANGPGVPAGWSIVGTADFNGDGKPDLLFYHPSDHRTYIWYMNGPTAIGSAPGPTLPGGWTIAGVGDFNSDGHPDYLLFNTNSMQTAIWYLNGPSFISSVNGPTLPAGWSIVAVADFNGDGKPDFFLSHPSDQRSYAWYMNGPTPIGSAPGPTLAAGWTVSGATDINGDGKPDLVFFHPSDLRTYIWYMNGLTPTSTAPGPTLPGGWSLVAP